MNQKANDSLRDGYVGGCVTLIPGSPDVVLDANHFISTLLLSDRYILHSVRLQEIPQLVRMFDLGPVLELLGSNWLKIKCDANLLAINGSAAELEAKGKLLEFEFIAIRAADHSKYISDSFMEMGTNLSLSPTEKSQLDAAVRNRIDFAVGAELGPDSPESRANRAALDEIAACGSVVRRAVEDALADYMKIIVQPDSFTLSAERVGDDTVRVKSNLEAIYGLATYRAHQVIQNGLLRVAALYGNLGLMDRYSATVAFNANDLDLSDLKLRLLARSLPDDRAQLGRVLGLAGFPSVNPLDTEKRVKLDRLLEIREMNECRQFRVWLRDLAHRSDLEIKNELSSYASWLGDKLNSSAARVLRFVVGQAADLVPGGGFVWSAFDDFFLEHFRRSEPIAFVNRLLPSVFG